MKSRKEVSRQIFIILTLTLLVQIPKEGIPPYLTIISHNFIIVYHASHGWMPHITYYYYREEMQTSSQPHHHAVATSLKLILHWQAPSIINRNCYLPVNYSLCVHHMADWDENRRGGVTAITLNALIHCLITYHCCNFSVLNVWTISSSEREIRISDIVSCTAAMLMWHI